MGRVKGIGGEREHCKTDPFETKHFDDWPLVPPCFEGHGTVLGTDHQSSTSNVCTTSEGEAVKTEEGETKSEGERMSWNVWSRFFTPKPTYFDRVTAIVDQIVQLECDLRDDENAAHEQLHEIAAARRELAVRVRRA